MKRNRVILMLVGIFITTFVQTMEYPEGKKEVEGVSAPSAEAFQEKLTLVSSDGTEFVLTKQVALQSPMLAALMQVQNTIDQTTVPSNVLNIIVELLKLQEKNTEPYTQSLLHNISKKIEQAQLSEQEIKELYAAADMYELKIFPAYVADRLYNQLKGNIDVIGEIIEKSFPSQQQFQEKIAHYLFLLHNVKLEVLEGLKLADISNYGFSIQELIDYSKIPPLQFKKVLNLSGLMLNSLAGFNTISNRIPAESIKIISLSHNKLTQVPSALFKDLSQVKKIDLSDNQIVFVDKDAFRGLDNLEDIKLSGNQLTYIDKEVFKGLPNLKLIVLSDNPIPPEDRFEIEGVTILWE